MRLAVVALAAMLALASPAGAARAPSAEGTLVACANRIGTGFAEGGDGRIFVQDFGAKAADSAR